MVRCNKDWSHRQWSDEPYQYTDKVTGKACLEFLRDGKKCPEHNCPGRLEAQG